MTTPPPAKRSSGPRKDKATPEDLRAVLSALMPAPLSEGQWEGLQRHYPVKSAEFKEALEMIKHWRANYSVQTPLARVLYRQSTTGQLLGLAHHPKLKMPSEVDDGPVRLGDCRWRLSDDKLLEMNSKQVKGDLGPVLVTLGTHKLKSEELDELQHMNAERLRLLRLFPAVLPSPESNGPMEPRQPLPLAEVPKSVSKKSTHKKDTKDKHDKHKDKKKDKHDKKDKKDKHKKKDKTEKTEKVSKKSDKKDKSEKAEEPSNKRKRVEVEEPEPAAPMEFFQPPLQPVVPQPLIPVQKQPDPVENVDVIKKYDILLPWFKVLSRATQPAFHFGLAAAVH